LKLKKHLRRCNRRRLLLELFEAVSDEVVARTSIDGFSKAASVNVWAERSLTRLVGSDGLFGLMIIGSTGLPTKKLFILTGDLLNSLE
jgi:hypothetical protein